MGAGRGASRDQPASVGRGDGRGQLLLSSDPDRNSCVTFRELTEPNVNKRPQSATGGVPSGTPAGGGGMGSAAWAKSGRDRR